MSSSRRTIIAMKGAPFTRKTEIATLIATSLSCTLLQLETILDAINPSISSPQDSAFNVICGIARLNLSGVCDYVVIDSLVSSRSYLNELIELAKSLGQTRVLIVECKPENIYSWQTKFEEYVRENPKITPKLYKAVKWDDISKAIQDRDYDETSEHDTIVSKLILDPIWDHLPKSGKRLFRSKWFAPQEIKTKPPRIMEAIKYMTTRGLHEVVFYRHWRHLRTSTPTNIEVQDSCRDRGHSITKYMELGFEESEVVNCMACGIQVKGSTYTCNYCSLALHKECAESFDEFKKWHTGTYSPLMGPSYYFPKVFACISCKEDEKPFSEDCKLCLFETHLKCRLMPTVIRHDCEKHFLSVELELQDNTYNLEGYKCLACGDFVSEMFYSCKICSIYYHFKCLTDIHKRVEDEHGGHHHHMQLKFSCPEAEDYNCDECLERRDPQLWFYSCEDCKYEVHLDCIFQKINYKPADRSSLHTIRFKKSVSSYKMKQRSIIAMKGAPFTRKTEIATFIATSLSCPLLSLESILDALSPEISSPQDLAFNILCNMAAIHLSNNICDNIVIDSPLSSKSHLDQLDQLAIYQAQVIIVECKPENTYSWQLEFEKYLRRNPDWSNKWYKAKNWDDVVKAIQDTHDQRSSFGIRRSKLKLDPLWDRLPKVEPRLFLSDRAAKQGRKPKPHPLMEVIQCMITRELVYSDWRNSRPCIDENCRDCGHIISQYIELRSDESDVVNCMACGKQIEGFTYTCSSCSLTLHKDCAESFDKEKQWHITSDPNPFNQPSYYFTEEYTCGSCKDEQKPFSEDCKLCLFETHLKSRIMPTVIMHDCHEHFLSIELLLEDEATTNNPKGYKCLACGDFVSEMFYSCKICSIYYHFTCLTKICIRMKDEHNGHHHHMQLKFSSEEAEDYICDECLEKRDPQLWFYSCQDCKFEVHLDCIVQRNRKPQT